MKYSAWWLPLIAICCSGSATLADSQFEPPAPIQTQQSTGTCGNLLAEIVTVPTKMKFVECRIVSNGDIANTAKYRVLAKDAEEIEAWLGRNFGMAKMSFICCGWMVRLNGEEEGVYQKGKTRYQISMYSEQENGTNRREWPKSEITFLVMVEKY
jgi:Domian of unknown function (DUF4952)